MLQKGIGTYSQYDKSLHPFFSHTAKQQYYFGLISFLPKALATDISVSGFTLIIGITVI